MLNLCIVLSVRRARRRTIDVHYEANYSPRSPNNIKFYDREYLLFIVLWTTYQRSSLLVFHIVARHKWYFLLVNWIFSLYEYVSRYYYKISYLPRTKAEFLIV